MDMVLQRLLHGEGTSFVLKNESFFLPVSLCCRDVHSKQESNDELVQLFRAKSRANTTPAMHACGMLYVQWLDFLYTLAL